VYCLNQGRKHSVLCIPVVVVVGVVVVVVDAATNKQDLFLYISDISVILLSLWQIGNGNDNP